MKRTLCALLTLCLLLFGLQALAGDAVIPENELGKAKHHTIGHDGQKRSYMLYIPRDIAPGAPLVFMLHGYGDFASAFMQSSGMNRVADAEGFAVVYPQGLSSDDKQFPWNHWNADFTYTEVDDTGFLTALAAHLQQAYGFAPEATFAAGLSNGGFMCYTLAVRSPGTFRAIASVAGTMSGQTWASRDNAAPIPVLQIHGRADVTIPINGTVFLDGGWGGAPDMDTVLAYWAGLGQAQEMPEETAGKIITRSYADDTGREWVRYHLIRGLGHEWPTEENSGLDTSAAIWSFFVGWVEDAM